MNISLRVSVLVLLLLSTEAARAQPWDVRLMLAQVSSSSIRLMQKQGDTTNAVETIQRSWAQRLVGVVDRMALAYEMSVPKLYLVKQSGANAFVTLREQQPLLVLNTDMLRLIGDDDDLMATVIGHELGHLQAKHLTDGAAKQGLVSLLGVLAGLAVDVSQAKRGVDTQGLGMHLGALGSDLVNAKFSRDQEREADDLGIRRMAVAGYDPRAVPRLWQLMAARGGGDGLFLSSHPSPTERQQAMQVAAATLSPAPAPAYAAAPLVDDLFPRSPFQNFALTPAELAAENPSSYRRAFEAHQAQRYDEALVAYREAGEVGDERALTMLGDYYMLARGGAPKDWDKANQFFVEAANKGFVPGIYMVGEMASNSAWRPADHAKAIRMFRIAEARGSNRAIARLSGMYAVGAGVAKDPVLARSMAQRAASAGDSMGKAVLGVMLREGLGGPADVSRSFELLTASAADKLSFGAYQLGLSYEKGLGTPIDKDKAIANYRQAAALGVPAAKERLKALGLIE